MIKQECIGIPDMILLLMIFCFKKIKIKAEIVLSPGGAYFSTSKLGFLDIFSPIISFNTIRIFDVRAQTNFWRSRLVTNIFRPHNLLCKEMKIMICVSFFFQICQNSTFYSILNLILRFTKEEAEIRKQAFPFVPARYIRTFDVISEVNCVLSTRR